MRLCVIADTHGLHDRIAVPAADLVIHAGDIGMAGGPGEVADFLRWWRGLPHPHKVLVAGNHDWLFQRDPAAARSLVGDCVYLEDSLAVVLGLRIYGSPWQPSFMDWAFNLERGPEIRARWDLIPQGVDILVTHGPPLGHGDLVERGGHEGRGVSAEAGVTFVNAAVVDARYAPVKGPVVLEV